MNHSQPSLMFDIPRSRPSDPVSSRVAEQKVRQSGQMKGEALKLLQLFMKHPGLSTKEISQHGIERYAAGRRASDLWRNGLVIRGISKSHDVKHWAILYSDLKVPIVGWPKESEIK